MTDNIWVNILGIVYIVLVIADVIVILLQQSKQTGLGALSGEANMYGGNMGSTKKTSLNKITIARSLVLVVLTVVLNILAK